MGLSFRFSETTIDPQAIISGFHIKIGGRDFIGFKSLPLSKDIGGFLSISNKFDLGISHRSNSSFSVMTLVKISKSFHIGYAYEAPTNTYLLNQSIKTNEFFLRFKFNNNDKEDLPEKTKNKSM